MKNKRGYFGIGILNPKTTDNMGTLWRTAYLYDADFIFTIGARYHKQPSDTPDASKHVPLYNFKTVEEFEKFLPIGSEVVCIEQDDKARDLDEVHHPERAVYLLGAEDWGIPKEYLVGKQTVQIPYMQAQSMNVAVAGSIIMYDRFVKSRKEVV